MTCDRFLNLLDVVGPLLIGVAIPFALLWADGRRSAFEDVRHLLDLISSDEIAQSRHRLGTFVANKCDLASTARALRGTAPEAEDEETLTNQLTQDLFRLAWPFERIHATCENLGWRGARAKKVAKSALESWITYWQRYFTCVAAALGATAIDDEVRMLTKAADSLGLAAPQKEGTCQ